MVTTPPNDSFSPRPSVYSALASAFEQAGPIEDLEGLLDSGWADGEAVDRTTDTGWIHRSADDRAADHQALFGLNVLPYASVFLAPDTMLGGPISQRVSLFRIDAGLDAAGRLPPDHISSELELMSKLGAGNDDTICAFLDTHLLSWLPAFAHAVKKEELPPYSRLVDFTLDVVLKHRGSFSGRAPSHLESLERVPAVLEDEASGIAEIAQFLTTPIWCGFYLSRAGIGRLGRGPRLPHGFGSRSQMMATLLHSAVDFDGLDVLTEGLNREIEEARASWRAFSREDIEATVFWANDWISRLDQAQALLDEMMKAVRLISSSTDRAP